MAGTLAIFSGAAPAARADICTKSEPDSVRTTRVGQDQVRFELCDRDLGVCKPIGASSYRLSDLHRLRTQQYLLGTATGAAEGLAMIWTVLGGLFEFPFLLGVDDFGSMAVLVPILGAEGAVIHYAEPINPVSRFRKGNVLRDKNMASAPGSCVEYGGSILHKFVPVLQSQLALLDRKNPAVTSTGAKNLARELLGAESSQGTPTSSSGIAR